MVRLFNAGFLSAKVRIKRTKRLLLVSEPPITPNAPPSWITPEKVVPMLLLPTVRFVAPKKAFPSPSMEPMVTEENGPP